MSALNETEQALDHGIRAVARQWEAAQASWKDTRASEFERAFYQPLCRQVNATLTALEELNEVIARAKRDLARAQ